MTHPPPLPYWWCGRRYPSLLTFDKALTMLPPCRMLRGHLKKTQTDLLQGTLDLLVHKTFQPGPTHEQLSAETET
jgi:hypothetical protein